MPTEPVIDVESLLAPLRGADPAGEPLSSHFMVRRDLEKARKGGGDGFSDTDATPPDWGRVVDLSTQTLRDTCKSLEVAARLTEGLTHRYGFAGLRDGLTLMARLYDECWDRVHPVPEEGEVGVRLGPVLLLNSARNTWAFPTAVARVPMFRAIEGEEPFAFLDWEKRREAFEAALAGAKPVRWGKPIDDGAPPKSDEQLWRDLLDDVSGALDALKTLDAALDRTDRFGTDAPNLYSEDDPDNLGRVVHGCLRAAKAVSRSKIAVAGDAADEGTSAQSEAPASGAGTVSVSTGVVSDRAGIYRQIGQLADVLQRIEPHSPIPYLLKRAVRLGAMPFPELMRAIIREAATVDELERLLGIEKPAEPGY